METRQKQGVCIQWSTKTSPRKVTREVASVRRILYKYCLSPCYLNPPFTQKVAKMGVLFRVMQHMLDLLTSALLPSPSETRLAGIAGNASSFHGKIMANLYAHRLEVKRLALGPLELTEEVTAATCSLSPDAYVEPITVPNEYVGSNWEVLAAGDTGICGIAVTYPGETPYYHLLVVPITKLTREPVTTTWEGVHCTPLGGDDPTTLALSPNGRLLAVAMRAGTGGRILLFYLDEQAHRLTDICVDQPVEWLRWSKHATHDPLAQLLAVCRHKALLITGEQRARTNVMSWVTSVLWEFEEECWGADWSPEDGRIAISLLGKVAGGKDLDKLAQGETVDNIMQSAGRVIVVGSQSKARLSTLNLSPESPSKLEDCSFTRLDWLEERGLLMGVTVYGNVAFCQLSADGSGAFKLTKVADDYFGEYRTLGVVEGRVGGFRRVYVAHLPGPLDMLILAASDQPRRLLPIDVKKMKHDIFGPGPLRPDRDNDLHGYCAYLMKDRACDGLENKCDVPEAVQGLAAMCVRTKLPGGAGECPLVLALGAGGTLFAVSVSDTYHAETALMHDAPSLDGPRPAWLGTQEAGTTA